MTRALVTQLMSALDYHQFHTRPMQYSKDAIKAAREYLATEPSGERAELISDLRRIADEGMADYANTGYPNSNAIKKAADMLEADADLRTQLARRTVERDMVISMIGDCIDAQQATPYGWMVSGVPSVMSGSLAQEIQEQEAKRIGGTCKAFPVYTEPQQAKRVQMTGEEIEKIADGCRAGAGSVWPHAFARAIEAHRDTPPAQKPTDWSAA